MRIAIPTTAKALFSASENHPASPLKSPMNGPRLLSTKKYVPPAFGIAVESSAFESTLGSIIIEAKRYESITAGPAFENAIAGRMKRPELIIAPEATENTSSSPSCLFSVVTVKATINYRQEARKRIFELSYNFL